MTEDDVVAGSFRHRLRTQQLVGYWSSVPTMVTVERLAGLGYDYLGFDVQHGVIGYEQTVAALVAVDAAPSRADSIDHDRRSVSLVRVPMLDRGDIGRALDAGASAVLVPMINTVDEAELAARACRYAPLGDRSFGPIRSALRIGPLPRVSDGSVGCVVMIETAGALAEVEKIAAVPGVDALYVGPSDLSLSLGATSTSPDARPDGFAAALQRIARAAREAGKGCLLHVSDGVAAAAALADGFTGATVANDLVHLEQAARAHLADARPS